MSTLLVAGSRQFEVWPQAKLEDVLNQASYALDAHFDEVMHGGARGVDMMAGKWAMSKDYPVQIVYAEWERHGKRAGFLRNQTMVKACDAAICVWDGYSAGTKMTIDLLAASRKDHVVVVRGL